MKLYFLLPVCTILIAIVQPVSLVSAQTPAANATDSAVIQENLRERIQKTAEQQKQVKGTSTSGLKRGFIGTIKRISEETMTLETTRGTLIVTLSDVALIQGNKTVNTSDIEIENSVVVLGYQNNDDFQPRRIIVSENSLRPSAREIVVGTVNAVDRSSITITPRGTTEKKIYAWQSSNRSKLINNQNVAITMNNIAEDQDVILITIPEVAATQSVKDSQGRVKLLYSLANTEN